MDTIDRKTCALMGPFALFVQGFMGLFVIGSLILKRAREPAKRPWGVWLADVSKQLIGQLFVHFSNVFISDTLAGYTQNACALYFLNILVDTTLGVFLIWVLLRIASSILIDQMGLDEYRSGFYGNPFVWRRWCKQLIVYIATLATMKICVVVLFSIFPFLVVLGNWAVGWLGDHEQAQLAFSMMVFPLIMNVFQFLLVDSIIKSNSPLIPSSSTSSASSINPINSRWQSDAALEAEYVELTGENLFSIDDHRYHVQTNNLPPLPASPSPSPSPTVRIIPPTTPSPQRKSFQPYLNSTPQSHQPSKNINNNSTPSTKRHSSATTTSSSAAEAEAEEWQRSWNEEEHAV